MMRYIKKHLYPILLIGILTIISLLNYTPGTFLTGWDTLHPEFDFGLNFQRLFYGVWREEQGLGAIAGHSHFSELPRLFILWILHFAFPLNLLRYLYIFGCLFLGVLGVYYLIRYIFKNNHRAPLIAFLTACFYLFSLSTAQQFYVPFEMFPTQYGFLPWLVLFTLKFLKQGSWKNLLLYSFLTLLATPQAYAAQLWYAFFGTYVSFLVLYYFLYDKNRALGKRILLLIAATITINSYWLLPNLYYLPTSSDVPIETKQNRLFTQEFRLRNREDGYIKDVALVRGFYMDWTIDNIEKGKEVSLMPDWQEHFRNPVVLALGYLYFASVVAGLIFAIRKKNRLFISFTPFFALPFIILMNKTFPFSLAYDFLIQFTLFEESLRFKVNNVVHSSFGDVIQDYI